jgi:hypothetical protein
MANNLIKTTLMAMAVLAASCATQDEAPLIGKQQPKIENGKCLMFKRLKDEH